MKKLIVSITTACMFRFGGMNSYLSPPRVDHSQYSQSLAGSYFYQISNSIKYQKTETVDDNEQESQPVNSIQVKTGSGAVIEIQGGGFK